jgi:hypothetical protein
MNVVSFRPGLAGSDIEPGEPRSILDRSILERLAQVATPLTRADEQLHPVDERLRAVLPWAGLKRGSVLEVQSRSMAWLLVAEAVAAGAWVAAVGVKSPGWAAAAESGVPLERVAVITTPPAEVAGTVLAALADAVELVLVDASVSLRPQELRRLTARVRERRGVLISCGESAGGSSWEGVDVRLRITRSTWHGLGQGHGALTGREVDIEATGRGAAFRPRRTTLWLQGAPTRWHSGLQSNSDLQSNEDTPTGSGESAHETQVVNVVDAARAAHVARHAVSA